MQKPYVICHMMATIDGKITSGTGADIMDNDYFDLYTQTEDELNGDSFMCGRVTMEMFASTEKIELAEESGDVGLEDFMPTKSEKGYFVGVDTKGTLRWENNFIKLSNVDHELPLILIVTQQTPKGYINYLKELKINYIFGGEKEVNFENVLSKLSTDFGIQKLLLEGGGKINGSLMAEDLIDEISLMVVPTVLNRSQAPTVFEKQTDIVKPTKYKLAEVKKLDKDCVWLRYKK